MWQDLCWKTKTGSDWQMFPVSPESLRYCRVSGVSTWQATLSKMLHSLEKKKKKKENSSAELDFSSEFFSLKSDLFLRGKEVKSKEKKPGPHAACGSAERAGPSCAGRVVGRATRRCGSAPTGAGSWR